MWTTHPYSIRGKRLPKDFLQEWPWFASLLNLIKVPRRREVLCSFEDFHPGDLQIIHHE